MCSTLSIYLSNAIKIKKIRIYRGIYKIVEGSVKGT